MTTNTNTDCSWWDRVSALLDDELPDAEKPLVMAHLNNCRTCASVFDAHHIENANFPEPLASRSNGLPNIFSENPPTGLRIILFILGTFILFNAAPTFVRGNTSGDALHDLRHLAMWQVAIGLGVCVAAFTFRMSKLLTIIFGSFLVLTVLASGYDLMTGHRGPWTDEVHILEVLAIAVLLRFIWPQLKILSQSRDTKKKKKFFLS